MFAQSISFQAPLPNFDGDRIKGSVEVGNRSCKDGREEGDKKGVGRQVLLLVKHARTLWHISFPHAVIMKPRN